MARRMRKHNGATTALWRDACGSALARSLRKRYWCVRLRKRYDASSSGSAMARRPAEVLWRDDCGSAIARRRRSGATPVEAFWHDACGCALSRRLRKRSGAKPADASGATPAEALRRDACGSTLTRRLR